MKETLEEAAESKAFEFKVDYKPFEIDLDYKKYAEHGFKKGFKEGAKWQQEQNKYSEEDMGKWMEERMYSEKEVLQLLLRLQQTESYDNLYDWFEQFKKK